MSMLDGIAKVIRIISYWIIFPLLGLFMLVGLYSAFMNTVHTTSLRDWLLAFLIVGGVLGLIAAIQWSFSRK